MNLLPLQLVNNQLNRIEVPFFSEFIFQSLFRKYPDAVCSINTDGRLLYFNNKAMDLLDSSKNNMADDFSYYLLNNKEIYQHFLIASEGKPQSFKTAFIDIKGKQRQLKVLLFPIYNEDMLVGEILLILENITEYAKHDEEINKIKKSLEMAQQVGKIGSWDYDVENNEVYWSKQLFKITGRENSNQYVPTIEEGLEWIHPSDRYRYKKVLEKSLITKKGYKTEYRVNRKDGAFIYVSEQVEMILNEQGNPIRLIGNTRDITDKKLAEMILEENTQMNEHIYANLPLGIKSYDVKNERVILISPGIESVSGYLPEQFSNNNFWTSIIHPDDINSYKNSYQKLKNGNSFDIQYRIYHKNGEIIWVQDHTIPVFDNELNLIRIDGIVTNITEQKKNEEKIKHFAFHDSITGLPNRKCFESKLENIISSSDKKHDNYSVLYLDINRFRTINDTLGHSIGDQLLKKFSNRLNLLLSKDDFFARIGNDIFGILVSDSDQHAVSEILIDRIFESLNEPFLVDGFELFLTVSIGVSKFPIDGITIDEILKYADVALYRAKMKGQNSFQFYSSSFNLYSVKQYDLEKDLRKSISTDQLCVHFQPRVNSLTGEMVSAEALIRWEHPVWGLVSPNEFIPLAEETGFINDIGDWVLHEVCKYISEWKNESLKVVPVSINMAAQRFMKNDWKKTYNDIFTKFNLDPNLIEIEITETTLIQQDEIVDNAFNYLKEHGIKIALDDFGTGYSSLSYMKDYPIDTIKIDRSFINQITKSPDVEVIITSLIYMAKGLNLNIVAEGVETIEQLSFLQLHQCNEIQGYIYSRPVNKDMFKDLLTMKVLKPSFSLE